MAQPGEPIPSKLKFWLSEYNGYSPYETMLLNAGINTVTKVSKATEQQLTMIGIPPKIASRMIATATSTLRFSNKKDFYNNALNIDNAAPIPSSAASAFSAPMPVVQPSHHVPISSVLPTDPKGSITTWPHFRNVTRDVAIGYLHTQPHRFMIRKSSLFPGDDNIFVIVVNKGTEIKSYLIQKNVQNHFMYIDDMKQAEIDPMDQQQHVWSNQQFGDIIKMVKTRFGHTFEPAILPAIRPAQGGRHKKHTRRHKKRAIRKHTMNHSKRIRKH